MMVHPHDWQRDPFRTMGPRRSMTRTAKGGFTLIEVMMIVLVVGITSAIAIPSIHGAMAERMARDSSSDLVLLSRRARSAAAAYGRAHVLRWGSGANGTFNVFRGRASSCNAATNNWTTFTASDCTAANPGYCVDQLVASDYQLGSTDVLITESTGRAFLDMCFEPNGRVLWRNVATNRFGDQNTVNGGFQFFFQRRENGTPVGVRRTIVVPLGGQARELR